MISFENGIFSLETKNSGYYIKITDGLLENLHYGGKADLSGFLPVCEKAGAGYGGDILHAGPASVSAQHLCLELSPCQRGDFRAPSLSLSCEKSGGTAELIYKSHFIKEGCIPPNGLAFAYGGGQTLCVSLYSEIGLEARLYYTVYEDADVITRRIELQNHSQSCITLTRAMSYQLDLPRTGCKIHTYTGAWARERHENELVLNAPGCVNFGSRTGTSSSFCNPFFMLSEPECGQAHGCAYGFNLIYSGSHEYFAEVSPYGKTRICAGVMHEGFEYTLAEGECFASPEAALTFSCSGLGGVSLNMHAFVNCHIVRGEWKNRERPVLFNNWEATYFDFTEGKIMRLAKEAAKLGAELFVLDDGWFSTRNADNSGLGDYNVNRKKLPGGLSGLAEKIKALGMGFGLWFEPEMVNVDSALYRAHPEWAICAPGLAPCEGRNQLVLDLCRPEVREYIISSVNSVLKSADISYVKWDMNRNLTDMYSPCLSEQGRFEYEYTRGLYKVLSAITAENPHILFEGCSSGGNRFDLGVLCYMPQIWTSDDTDAFERLQIQHGTYRGYPQSCVSCHVSASPNHQAARQSPLDARFDTAAFGVLGYELDLNVLSPAEKKVIKGQIKWYKSHRRLLQYGALHVLADNFKTHSRQWLIVSPDKLQAVFGDFTGILIPNSAREPARMRGLLPEKQYKISVRGEFIDIRTFGSLINHILPVKVNTSGHLVHAAADVYMLACESEEYTASGSLLINAGLKLKQAFTGTGYNENVRLLPDFSARLYYIREIKNEL